jgi:catechol 2,3-dioxygenase-like lactoylglutathione lyase family enzyme
MPGSTTPEPMTGNRTAGNRTAGNRTAGNRTAGNRTAGIRTTGLDHIVLYASDVERTLAFYVDDLGLTPVRVEEWRRGAVPFPSVRVDESTIIDLLQGQPHGRNLDHFCLVVAPVDFDAIKAGGMFDVVDGPDVRYGARGDGTSLYVRDPDGTVVELRYY